MLRTDKDNREERERTTLKAKQALQGSREALREGLRGFFQQLQRSSHHGLNGDAAAGQHPVPPGLGWGLHQLCAAYVECDRLRGQLHCDLSDYLGGHLDDLCGSKHRIYAVQTL